MITKIPCGVATLTLFTLRTAYKNNGRIHIMVAMCYLHGKMFLVDEFNDYPASPESLVVCRRKYESSHNTGGCSGEGRMERSDWLKSEASRALGDAVNPVGQLDPEIKQKIYSFFKYSQLRIIRLVLNSALCLIPTNLIYTTVLY